MKISFIICLFAATNVFSQGITFYREDINFTIDRNYFYVDGYYWFANNSDKNVEGTIYFPVGNKNDRVVFDSVQVFVMPQSVSKSIMHKTSLGFYFRVNVNVGDTVTYNIKYRQKLSGDSVKYILLSTKTWNKPLVYAVYKLIVKQNIAIKKFSYTPDKVYSINNEKIFYWEQKNFMPERDMEFNFTRNYNVKCNPYLYDK